MTNSNFPISSPKSWLNLYIIVGAHFALIVMLYIFVAQPSLAKVPEGLNILQLGILAVSSIAVPGLAYFITKPKLNAEGQRVLKPFYEFQSQVIIMCSFAELNTLIGVFTGRGYQIYIGMAATVVLLVLFVIPVLMKMRQLYKLTES